MKSKEPGSIGLWSATTLVVDPAGMKVLGMHAGEPEFIEQAASRLGVMVSDAASDLKGQPIDRGQK